MTFKSDQLINHNTVAKSNYYANYDSILLNKVYRYKTFASHRNLKYKNKLVMRLYNASNTTKSFWLSIINPILNFFHKIGVYLFQGVLYISAIPFLRIRIKIHKWRVSNCY